MVRFENISITFPDKKNPLKAVDDVSFDIRKGEIFGIVGSSGAGKSTLLRTINLLQRPTSGSVFVNGADITHLKGENLRRLRLKIGMIFQQFNLIRSKTVYENIAFALSVAGKSKDEIKTLVPEALEVVGLSDKAGAYPSNLSGGQKQRVGIARAIANRPEILLCDEPTSALDPETTESVLKLLKDINIKLGITTVIITHEMNVIKRICNRVAVMSGGKVLELDDIFNVFSSPAHEFTRGLINHTINLDLPARLKENDNNEILKIIYKGDKAEEAIISQTVRKFDVNMNILHGKIEYISGKPLGILLVRLEGKAAEVSRAKEYIRNNTYKIKEIDGN